MTTIAYTNRIIAYDSRAVSGSIIVDDDIEKKLERDGSVFFCTGIFSDNELLIDLYFDKSKDFNIDCAALIIENNKVFQVCVEDGRLHKSVVDMGKPYAIGSGRDHAWTAMDLGCTAERAVEMAIKRDWGSGGQVRIFEINN